MRTQINKKTPGSNINDANQSPRFASYVLRHPLVWLKETENEIAVTQLVSTCSKVLSIAISIQ